MSFGGHVNDMVNRIKQNAALKEARRRKFKGGNNYTHISHTKAAYNFPKLSKEEFIAFQKKVKLEAKQEKIKQLKILLFVASIVMLLLFVVFSYY
jgi:hypothetical protein